MFSHFDRRDFLKHTAAVAAAGAMGGIAGSLARAGAKNPPFRISLAEWSLHRTLNEKKLDNLDFARTAKQDFGIDAIEFVNQFFKDKAGDQAYLVELKKRADDLGVKMLLMMIDN